MMTNKRNITANAFAMFWKQGNSDKKTKNTATSDNTTQVVQRKARKTYN